ncbi:MAG: PQQ-binding-like beta-propeller repeat protein [Nitrospiria bacterium]
MPANSFRTDPVSFPLYVVKDEDQNTIYQLDPKTGKDLHSFLLPKRDSDQSIIVSDELIVYAIKMNEKEKSSFNQWVAIDKKTGEVKWINNVDKELGNPQQIKSMLIFSNQTRVISEGLPNLNRQTSIIWTIREISPPCFICYIKDNQVSNQALAIDFKTGQVLWKVELDGEDHPLIENLTIEDNRIFIKSLDGWLYALEKKWH